MTLVPFQITGESSKEVVTFAYLDQPINDQYGINLRVLDFLTNPDNPQAPTVTVDVLERSVGEQAPSPLFWSLAFGALPEASPMGEVSAAGYVHKPQIELGELHIVPAWVGAPLITAGGVPIPPGEGNAYGVGSVFVAGRALDALIAAWADKGHRARDLGEWWRRVDGWRATRCLDFPEKKDAGAEIMPQRAVKALFDATRGRDPIITTEVGQHQMWAAQFVKYEKPRTWLNSGGLGTMGYSIPAAMGAKMADPDLEVWAVDGDGCFQMTNQELATCAIEGIPIKVALINNGNLGMVRQWQTLFYEERYSNTDLATHSRRIPDFVKLAEALGCVAWRVEKEEDVAPTIAKAREINDRPVLIDFIVGADAQVWPMVAAGTGNDEIMAARGIRPLFDDEEAAAEPAAIHEAMVQGADADAKEAGK